MNSTTVGFAGLTHLGLVSAAATAAKGFKVVGFDPDRSCVEAIAVGRLPILEPGLDDLCHMHKARLIFSHEVGALAACDVVYISTDVPTDDQGSSNLVGIRDLIQQVLPVLKRGGILVILCQVPPGFTRQVDFAPRQLYYQVETLVFGRAVERATQPERFIVGCADPAQPLPPFYKSLLDTFGCPVIPMGYESAELTKISINCCLVASVTVANTLAELSERIGADWREIVPALKLDKRIGPHAYLSPGLGIAGGNLERDLATVLRYAEATGIEASVIEAFRRNSRHRSDWVLRTLHAEVLARRPEAVIGVLGLAYKEHTRSTKNSPSLTLIAQLKPWRLRVHDPAVPASTAVHPNTTGCDSALETAQGVDALVVMTPWPSFRDLEAGRLARVMAGRAVIDPYGVLDGNAVASAGLDYFTLGSRPQRTADKTVHA